jgi:soluble P-type ATPase
MNKDELNGELMKGLDISDLMLDMMIATGDRKAKIMKKSSDIMRILYKIEEEFTKEDSKDTEQIVEFLEDKEKEIKTFYNNLKGDE